MFTRPSTGLVRWMSLDVVLEEGDELCTATWREEGDELCTATWRAPATSQE
jgi:hypothetical protein